MDTHLSPCPPPPAPVHGLQAWGSSVGPPVHSSLPAAGIRASAVSGPRTSSAAPQSQPLSENIIVNYQKIKSFTLPCAIRFQTNHEPFEQIEN